MASDNTGHTNGNSSDKSERARDIEKKYEGRLHRSAFRALVQDFGPLWFTWSMNSGVLGILTHQCPYQFSGLQVISTIFYIFDLIIFIIFSLIMITRFAMFGLEAFNEIAGNMVDLTMMACWPIAWLTLASLTPVIVSNAYWGGHGWSIFGYVMWWFGLAWSVFFLFGVFITLIQRHDITDGKLPINVIIPAVSVSTVAVTGGLIVSLSYHVSPRLAVPVIITSFMTVGIGILLGLILTTYLFYNLLAKGWPAPALTTSVFILVGPMGQSAAALQELASAARMYGAFGGYNRGSFITAESAMGLEPACVLIALMLSGLGIVWTLLSIYAMCYRAYRRELSWNPTWNSIIFPTATLVTSFTLFAQDMASPAFGVVTAAMIIILIIVFLVNLAFTGVRIAQGQLLIVREDPRIKKQIEEEQKEK